MLSVKLVRFAHYRHAVNGRLYIGGMHVCDTLEHEAHCLPIGSYPLTVNGWPKIVASNGPYNLTDGSVSVGECHHIGFLVNCNVHFDLLHNRLRKLQKRGGEAQLIIVNEVAIDDPVVDNEALHCSDISAEDISFRPVCKSVP